MVAILMMPLFVVMLAVTLMFACILGAAVGAFSGWVLTHVPYLGEWVVSGLRTLGVYMKLDDLIPLGAALGFVGGFFRSVNKSNKE